MLENVISKILCRRKDGKDYYGNRVRSRHMQAITRTILIRSKGEGDMIDITLETSKLLTQSKLKDGIVTIFVSGSTAAVTTIEYMNQD